VANQWYLVGTEAEAEARADSPEGAGTRMEREGKAIKKPNNTTMRNGGQMPVAVGK